MKSTDISTMNGNPGPDAPPPPAAPAVIVIGSPELAAMWPDFPPRTRALLLRAAGRQWFDFWRSGAPLDDIPPLAWGWNLCLPEMPLSLPPSIAAPRAMRLSQPKMVASLAEWLHEGSPARNARERLRILFAFARRAPLDRAARRNFYLRVDRAARRAAAERAKEVNRDVIGETADLCRQSVQCRGLWLPDTSLTPDDLRHAIEAALRAPDAVTIKQSDVALVVRSYVCGEFVVIKRHRLARPGLRLKYLWRKSRARRAWIAGRTLLRLGIPVAEPLGFLELVRRGRVTDSFIITRWLPDCRTASRAALGIEGRAARRRAMLAWRDEWLHVIARGVYHADTKLSNAMVQDAAGGTRKLFWTDLECVHIGARLTRYRVLRNIVQMNGALGPQYTLRDRIFFLRSLPPRFAWLRARWCRRIIRNWAARRRAREESGRCGS